MHAIKAVRQLPPREFVSSRVSCGERASQAAAAPGRCVHLRVPKRHVRAGGARRQRHNNIAQGGYGLVDALRLLQTDALSAQPLVGARERACPAPRTAEPDLATRSDPARSTNVSVLRCVRVRTAPAAANARGNTSSAPQQSPQRGRHRKKNHTRTHNAHPEMAASVVMSTVNDTIAWLLLLSLRSATAV